MGCGVLLVVALGVVGGALGHEGIAGGFFNEFIRRPAFRSRLRWHPDTGKVLRTSPMCNLTGTWTGIAKDGTVLNDEYFLDSVTDTMWTAMAVTTGNWSSGTGHVDPSSHEISVRLDHSSAQGIDLNGTLASNCSLITWRGAGKWVRQQSINKVHVVFMNHLDIGYAIHTPEGNPIGFMANVINTYTSEYFPAAAALSKALRELGHKERFIYTTHPWLVSLYLDCPPNYILANGTKLYCPTSDEMAVFKEAVARGDITWHDGPFNLQSENVGDAGLFEWGLEITNDINRKLGRVSTGHKVYNLRDVPGTTRGVVPILARNNFTAITVGQNPGTPATGGWATHKIFLWKDLPSGTEIIGLNHAGGYPNDAGPSPQQCGGLCREDCMMAPGFDEALCFAFRTDNSGPPTSVQDLLSVYDILRVEFPGADVVASTLKDFVMSAEKKKDSFEVVTEEIGDTWIQGVQSDPWKMTKFREIVRQLQKCREAGECSISDPRLLNATRLLLTIPEHTWGLPGTSDNRHWNNTDFAKVRNTQDFYNLDEGWREHRVWADYAVEAMGSHPVASRIRQAVERLRVKGEPSTTGYTREWTMDRTFTCGKHTLGFDGVTGSLSTFEVDGVAYASPKALLGELVYSSYTDDDFDRMNKVYHGPTGGGCGYYKPNMDQYGHPVRADTRPTMMELWLREGANGTCSLLVKGVMPRETVSYYGAPETVWTNVTVAGGKVTIDLQLFNKTATRLAEAMHYTFHPVFQAGMDWKMHKLGGVYSPYETLLNGNPKQHTVWEDVWLEGSDGKRHITMKSLDAAVASPSQPQSPPTPFLFDMAPLAPRSVTGMGFNLWNNIWETNYAFYYPFLRGVGDENMRFRFEVLV